MQEFIQDAPRRNGKTERVDPVDDHMNVMRTTEGVGVAARVSVHCETCGTGPAVDDLRRATCLEATHAAMLQKALRESPGDRNDWEAWLRMDRGARKIHAASMKAARQRG